MNRLIIIQMASEFLSDFLRRGVKNIECTEGALPEDAVLVSVAFDGRTISLTYQSDTFDEVAEGAFIPRKDVHFKDTRYTGW